MALGRHTYKGKNDGKTHRFLSKLTTPKERGQMKKLKKIFKKIEHDHLTRKPLVDQHGV